MKTVQDMVDLGYTTVGHPDGTRLRHPDSGFSYIAVNNQVEDAVYTEAANRKAMWDKLVLARDTFGGNYRDWTTMTTQQKDTANRQAQRALANITRTLIGDLSTPGD